MSAPILLVAHHESTRHLAQRILARCGRVTALATVPTAPGPTALTVACVGTTAEAAAIAALKPQIVLVDPGVDLPAGLTGTTVVITTPYAPEALIAAAQSALQLDTPGPTVLLGRSSVMERLRQRIARVAPTQIPVLLVGETGTGKELAAREVHRVGGRGAFVALNCGAIPAELLEAELFGVTRGAYSGATHSRPGLFELADGGTLFLDEVGDLPLPLQVKLNRAIAEGEFRRVGDPNPRHASPRIVAATHRDLATMIDAGTFREDLYFRLAVVRLELPPLRQRTSDIPVLAQAFLDEVAGRMKRTVPRLSTLALRELAAHPWPGNVRELRNTMSRALVFVDGGLITPDHLELERSAPLTPPVAHDLEARGPDPLAASSYRDAVEAAERYAGAAYLEALLVRHGGVVSACARAEGVERETMHRWLKRHGLTPESFRDP